MKAQRIKSSLPAETLLAACAGREPAELEAHLEEYLDGPEVNVPVVQALFDKALELYPERDDESRKALDRFIAPRLHYTLRLTPRQAGDMRFWAWLALGPLRKYVNHRWYGVGRRPDAVWDKRFVGDATRNAIARLWWYSEMARNGESYEPVEQLFEDTGTLQYAMEASFSRYRPAVIAFVRVSRGVGYGRALTFGENKTLSMRINAYSVLRAVPGIGLSDSSDGAFDEEWHGNAPESVGEVLNAEELLGPRDGEAAEESIVELEKWFAELIGLKKAA